MPQSFSDHDLLAPGTILAQRYRIEQHIGSGGYANVYRAIDLNLRRERAIKEVFDSDKGVRDQFTVEASLLIQSTHPNIPRGYQLFEERGKLYLVMEFVRGRDLEDLLNESLVQRHRPLDEAQVLQWAIESCGALEEMHQRRPPVIHRDIKPANIKITPEGKPVLIDFGLAKLQTSGPTHTAAQGVSPGFAPPEQYMARGQTDARTDIYGMGATLYACLTGKDPPEAPARLLAETGAAGQRMVPPRDLAKPVTVSEATNALVVRTLELPPARRQQTARELHDNLVDALARLQSGALGQSSARRAAVVLPGAGPAAPGSGGLGGPKPAPVAARATAKQPALPPPAPAQPRQPAAMVAPPARSPQAMPSPMPQPMPTMMPPPRPQPVAAGVAPVPGGAMAATGKQQAAATLVAPPRDEHIAQLPVRGTAKQKATGKQQVLAPHAGGATAVVGALALAPTIAPSPIPLPIARGRGARRDTRAKASAAATDAAPLVPRPRSWLNLHGPELTSMGKFALAMSATETCWGLFLVALAVIQVVTHGQNRALPFLVAAMIWLGVILLVCLLGGQVLSRPVLRRGHMGKLRRGLQGTGLTAHALAVHGVAIWGAIALAQHHLDPALALVAFALFAVNVLAGGVLSLANTLS
ncbi:MAG TPA: protein kinase [Ktedonobacterales bacterium]|nr:protein kinase [Ktedonobacterales bacterium]